MPQVLQSTSGRTVSVDAEFAQKRFPGSSFGPPENTQDIALQRVDSDVLDWYQAAQTRPAISPLPAPPASRVCELARFADVHLGPLGARQVVRSIGQTWTDKTALAFVSARLDALSVSGCQLKQEAIHWLLGHFGEVSQGAAYQAATATRQGAESLNDALLDGVDQAYRKMFAVENCGGDKKQVAPRLRAMRDAVLYRSYEAALLHLFATCEPQLLSENYVIGFALRLGYSGLCLDAVEEAFKAARRLRAAALESPSILWAKENDFADVIEAHTNLNIDARWYWYTTSASNLLLPAAYKARHYDVLREAFRATPEDEMEGLSVDLDSDSDDDDDVATLVKGAEISLTGSDTLENEEDEADYAFLGLCLTGNLAAIQAYLEKATPDQRLKALSNGQAAAVLIRRGHGELFAWLISQQDDCEQSLFTGAMIAMRDRQYDNARLLLKSAPQQVKDAALKASMLTNHIKMTGDISALAFALEIGSDVMRREILQALRGK